MLPVNQVLQGDCLDVLKGLPDNSVDALVTDPPSGTSFMGKSWDTDKGGAKEWIEWLSAILKECYRVMKPGAHGVIWALPRTSHWTGMALELSDFEIRDCIVHHFGSGFPKNLDVSKALDKTAKADREVVSSYETHDIRNGQGREYGGGMYAGEKTGSITVVKTKPATDLAKQYDGFGTALKPSSEFWWLVRKPLERGLGVAANVTKWGTGGINIGLTRVGVSPQQNNLMPSSRHNAVSGILSSFVSRLRSADTVFEYPEFFLDCLQSTVSELRSYSNSHTNLLHNGAGQGGNPQVGELYSRNADSLPSGILHDPSLIKSLNFQGDCPACHDFYDVHVRGVLKDGLKSVASLIDALSCIYSRLLEQPHTHDCLPNVRPSNLDVLNQILSFIELLSNSIISYSSHPRKGTTARHNSSSSYMSHKIGEKQPTQTPYTTGDESGQRWPSNLLLSHSLFCVDGSCDPSCPIAAMDAQSGESESKASGYNWQPSNNNNSVKIAKNIKSGVHFQDSGGASRFFPNFSYSPEELDELYFMFRYFAKPSQTERNTGLESLPERVKVYNGQSGNSSKEVKPVEERFTTVARNTHVTVKGQALMRWLCTLVCPPNGVVLDPFAGSGSTLIAAYKSGFQFIGIEREEEYVTISKLRLDAAKGLFKFTEEEAV